MPNTREKLIELLKEVQDHGAICHPAGFGETYDWVRNNKVADHLIANGVTFDKDNNVPSKWIPVTERLPELHTKVLCCGIKGGRFIAELGTWGHEKHLYWDKKNGQGSPTVTHWMPLPEPPKGE